MNKKTTLLVGAAATALALTTVVLAGLGSKGFLLSADTEPGGSITIDATLLDCPFQEGEFQAESKKGNLFSFNSDKMTMSDGVFTIEDQGSFWNDDVLNGLYKLEVTFTESATVHLIYGSDAYGVEEEMVDVTGGLNTIKFNKFDPQWAMIGADGSDLKFSKIVFYYSCIADTPEGNIYGAQTRTFGDWEASCSGLIAPTGTLLSEIDPSAFLFETSSGSIEGSGISNFQVSYSNIDSATVVDDTYQVSVSFVYNEVNYSGSGMELLGYSNSDTTINTAYLPKSYVRQQATDDIPEGFMVHLNASCNLKDEGESILKEFYLNKDVQLTDEMVVSLEPGAFTVLGQHSMVLNVYGVNLNPYYDVYNPEINNISGINCYDGSLEVDEGTTTDEFLALIATKTFHINYYEDDKSLPHETTLGAENFSLKGNEFDGSSLQVLVPLTYETYSGYLEVRVNKAPGTLIAEYHNDEGVSFMGGVIYRIALFDNGVATLYRNKTGDYSTDVTYSLDGTTLTLYLQSTPFLFTIDEENHTFENYASSATVLYSFKVDFSAFGGGATLYDGRMYDDNTVAFDVGPGMTVTCPFTFDPSDNTIIYFNFMGADAVGTIDYGNLTMVVAPVK